MTPPLVPETVVTHGRGRYVAHTVAALGIVPNPHLWIGAGFFYCVGCRAYQYHDAYSHPGQADCFEVCRGCQQYYARQR